MSKATEVLLSEWQLPAAILNASKNECGYSLVTWQASEMLRPASGFEPMTFF